MHGDSVVFRQSHGNVLFRRPREANRRWARTRRIVKKRLDLLHYAAALNDLRSPPGNRLKALKGKHARLP